MVRYKKEGVPPGDWKGIMPQIVKAGKKIATISMIHPMTEGSALNLILD